MPSHSMSLKVGQLMAAFSGTLKHKTIKHWVHSKIKKLTVDESGHVYVLQCCLLIRIDILLNEQQKACHEVQQAYRFASACLCDVCVLWQFVIFIMWLYVDILRSIVQCQSYLKGQNKIGWKKFGIALVPFGAFRPKPDCTLEPALCDSLNPKVKEFFLGIGVQAFFPDPVQTLERSHKNP